MRLITITIALLSVIVSLGLAVGFIISNATDMPITQCILPGFFLEIFAMGAILNIYKLLRSIYLWFKS